VTETEKARQPAAFGLIGIHWKGGVTESTRMSDVICATSYAVAIPRVHDIEHERCVKTDRRMQATGRLPGSITHTRDIFAVRTRRVEGKSDPSHRDNMAPVNQTTELHLDALDR